MDLFGDKVAECDLLGSGPLPNRGTIRFHSISARALLVLVVTLSNGVMSWCVTMLQLSAESTELVELRELREDVERRERAQAAVIENQAKRLDELETLYKVGSLLMCQHGKQRLSSASAGLYCPCA